MIENKKMKILDILIAIIGIILGGLILFPTLFALLSAFKSPAEFSYPAVLLPNSFAFLENFKDAFSQAPLLRFMLNSLIMALLGAFLRILIVGSAAYAFTFYDFKAKNMLFIFLVSSIMIPGDVLIITNYLTVSNLSLMDSYLGMVLPFLMGASQLFMLRQNFSMIPKSLKEAALLDGCSDFQFICHVVYPISKPVLAILFVQSFISFFNSYLWPLLITNKTNMRTIQVGLSLLASPENNNYGLIMAAVSVVLLPSFLLLLILRKTMKNNNMIQIEF